MEASQTALERRDRLRAEGKTELQLNVDTKKYLLSFVKYRDMLISLPLFFLGLLIMWYLHKTQFAGGLTVNNSLMALGPWIVFLSLLSFPDSDRKNINFITSKIVWRYKFKRRQKLFVLTKGDQMGKKINSRDIRSQLGIKNIFSECYETVDNRYVKVITVSSINLSLLNTKEEDRVYSAYEAFLNDLPRSMLPLQTSQISQPINLTNYGREVKQKMEVEQNRVKRALLKSYGDHVDQIQKNKDMVSRNRYVMISRSFTTLNRKKVLEDLERDAEILTSSISNMLGGRHKLKARKLNNDELFELIFTCIDYENAQVSSNFKSALAPVTVGERTSTEMREHWKRLKADHIL